ncbi:helix-turn-helix transcriptional regulator [Pedobacter sp. UC225_61]|uniref:helix-turn-helix transcriptional regulator n=1 Tax=Pedobacter sp. UC225_61 TaxID=3374623 RepID=UPI0037A60DB7
MKRATGKVIKAFRKHLNYKQEFVAKKINITTETLANIENGRVGIDLEKLYLISLLFKVPAREILSLILEIFDKGNDEGLASAVKQLRVITDDEDLLE